MTVGAARKAEIAKRDDRVAAAYRSGEFAGSIAQREGISRPLVSLILKQQGSRLSEDEARRRWIQASHTPAARQKASEANTRPLAERFAEKVEKGASPDGCWIWAGALDGVGYPQIYMSGRRGKASHASLVLDGRPRPVGLNALHTCDNPICVNPKHLWWGTQLENIRDAKSKGRLNLTGLALGLAARLG